MPVALVHTVRQYAVRAEGKMIQRGGSSGKKSPAVIGAEPGHMGKWPAAIGAEPASDPDWQISQAGCAPLGPGLTQWLSSPVQCVYICTHPGGTVPVALVHTVRQ